MADVNVAYVGETIAELDGTGSKTLKTGGTYCEGDIEVAYAPRCRSYEITLAKASGWVLLTELDDDVLEHIDDDALVVTFYRIASYEYTSYAVYLATASNTPCGYTGNYPVYGRGSRQTGENVINQYTIFYKPSDSGTATGLGGGRFRVSGGKFYIYPSDGFVAAGEHRLTFTW